MSKKLNVALLVLAAISFIYSCRKDFLKCESNCTELLFNGRLYRVPEMTPVGNLTATAVLDPSPFCFSCKRHHLATKNVSGDGLFNFSRELDASLFRSYGIEISVPPDSNFFILPNDGMYYCNGNNSWQLQDLRFEFYSKCILTIKLHRTLNDNFKFFHVWTDFQSLSFGSHVTTNFDIPWQNTSDTTYSIETAANVYTRIAHAKYDSSGFGTQFIDTIICKPNQPNIYELDY